MQNFGMSMLWFWVSYMIVTMIGIGHTIFNIVALHMKSMNIPIWMVPDNSIGAKQIL